MKLGNPNESYIQCLTWFNSQYDNASESEQENNRNQMKTDWNLQDGCQALQKQIQEVQLFEALTNAAIVDVDAIDIAVTVLMNMFMKSDMRKLMVRIGTAMSKYSGGRRLDCRRLRQIDREILNSE